MGFVRGMKASSPYRTQSVSRSTWSAKTVMITTPIANRVEKTIPIAASGLILEFLWMNSMRITVTMLERMAPMKRGERARESVNRKASAMPGRRLWLMASPTRAIFLRIM